MCVFVCVRERECVCTVCVCVCVFVCVREREREIDLECVCACAEITLLFLKRDNGFIAFPPLFTNDHNSPSSSSFSLLYIVRPSNKVAQNQTCRSSKANFEPLLPLSHTHTHSLSLSHISTLSLSLSSPSFPILDV